MFYVLHAYCCACLETLLDAGAPIMARNNDGKTPRDVASPYIGQLLDEYMRQNRDKIYAHYDVVYKQAKRKYSQAEHITWVFVIGHRGAGKSSLIETLTRDSFFDTFGRVSESSVPCHIAGIVPSVYSDKLIGRVLFYDFAGDPEYYSSHAAILENLVLSRKGDNIFVIVVDLTEEVKARNDILCYWVSFIKYQEFFGRKPHLLIVGSHADLLAGEEGRREINRFHAFCDGLGGDNLHVSATFTLDCCKPKSKSIADIKNLLQRLTSDSPCDRLSGLASMLLGLLEKDFSQVPACSISKLLSHIEETGISLPTDMKLLYPMLQEIHDLGLLFLIGGQNGVDLQVVLNMSKFTNVVHRNVFSKEARDREEYTSFFNIGILPEEILGQILPDNITKDCLVQLQYCQEIGHNDVRAFPSLSESEGSANQSSLFFPALCCADKGGVEWVIPASLSCSVGWLARCVAPFDYYPPRFLHVFLLTLVFDFTLTAPPLLNHTLSDRESPDLGHFRRRCTMWKTGIHWLMEEGVECMV